MNKYTIIIALFVLNILNIQNVKAQSIYNTDTLTVDTIIATDKIIEPRETTDTVQSLIDTITVQNSVTDTVVYRKPRTWFALTEDLAINASILGFDRFAQNRDYARVSLKVIKNNFKTGFVWDNDSFSGNQFSHPFHGSLFYNAARDNGLTYWESLPFPVIGSAVWELFCETNEPAINDLLSTGIGGTVLGEVTHRTSDLIFDDRRTGIDRIIREITGSLINPIRGIRRLITGQSWRISRFSGNEERPEPLIIGITSGTRFIGSHGWIYRGQAVSFIEFRFDYGDRFDSNFQRPFDLFHATVLFNMNYTQSSVGDLDIWGRICDKKYYIGNNWKLNFGGYQMLKYVETKPIKNQPDKNFPIISEAVSFGTGLYAEYEHNNIVAANDLIFGLVPLGGFRSDYFPNRTYNFASGFSIRENISLKISNKILIGDKFYFARFYVLKGYSPEKFEQRQQNQQLISTMGDKGNCSVFTNKIYLQFKFIKRLKIDVATTIHYRRTNYKYYPKIKGRSYEFRLGLAYTIDSNKSKYSQQTL